MSVLSVAERIAVEKEIVGKTVDLMQESGWNAVAVHDGEELVKTEKKEEVIVSVFSVDESRVVFKKNNEKCMVLFVIGNSGWDVISDHSYPGENHEFVQIMDKVQEFAESFIN